MLMTDSFTVLFDINSPDEALHAIHSCISDILSWMTGNKLKINDDKTEFFYYYLT